MPYDSLLFLLNIERLQSTPKKIRCRKDILWRSLSRNKLLKPFTSG